MTPPYQGTSAVVLQRPQACYEKIRTRSTGKVHGIPYEFLTTPMLCYITRTRIEKFLQRSYTWEETFDCTFHSDCPLKCLCQRGFWVGNCERTLRPAETAIISRRTALSGPNPSPALLEFPGDASLWVVFTTSVCQREPTLPLNV